MVVLHLFLICIAEHRKDRLIDFLFGKIKGFIYDKGDVLSQCRIHHDCVPDLEL